MQQKKTDAICNKVGWPLLYHFKRNSGVLGGFSKFSEEKKKKRRDESSSSSVTHISLKISIAQKLQNSFKLQKQQAKAHAYHCQHNIPQIYLTMDSLSSHAKLQFVE